MKKKHKRKIKRILHRSHTKLLGGKQTADKLRRDAADLRIQHDLCRCADEEKTYRSAEESAADKSPPVACANCGKQRLRVAVLLDAAGNEAPELSGEDKDFAELALIDLLK